MAKLFNYIFDQILDLYDSRSEADFHRSPSRLGTEDIRSKRTISH